MADIRSWSTTAASNNATPPDGWPEGMAPSTVNNTARETHRAIKKQWSQAEWFSHGDDVATSTIRKDGQTISLSGTHTATYHIGRRIRALDTVPTWLYGTITDVSFSTGTQVSVAWDTGSLTATVTAVELAILSQTNQSLPQLNKTITSHDAGATAAPDLTLFRDSASPADADFGGRVLFDGRDSAGSQVTYGSMDVQFDDVTDASEDASLLIKTQTAGTLTTQVDLSSAAMAVTPVITASGGMDGILGANTPAAGTLTSATLTGSLYRSFTDNVTAGTTQTQAGATALTTDTNRVTVSGTDGDGVALFTAVANARILVINDDAAQTIQIWPASSDTIDGGAADAVDANSLAAGNSREYLALDATNWVTVTNPVVAAGLASGDVIPADDGAVGAPGLTFKDDTDNGIYRIGANNIAVAAAGAKVADFHAGGEISFPLQPDVMVFGDAQANVTGAGTAQTLTWGGSEIRDQGSNFASDVFTAPVTGTYDGLLHFCFSGVTSGMTRCIINMTTSNRTIPLARYDIYATTARDTPAGQGRLPMAFTMDMDASDTLTNIICTIVGGSDVVDISASSYLSITKRV